VGLSASSGSQFVLDGLKVVVAFKDARAVAVDLGRAILNATDEEGERLLWPFDLGQLLDPTSLGSPPNP
jgi:hypothetical protein